MLKKTEFTGPYMRVARLQHEDWSYVVPASYIKHILEEILDYSEDDQLEYTITFASIPKSEFDALPEFNG